MAATAVKTTGLTFDSKAISTLEKMQYSETMLRQRAVDLCAVAYGPQPVPQPDGATLHLCWNGRIARGYERLAEARNNRDADRIRTLENAIKSLEAKYNDAANAAEAAASQWAAMAAAGGVTAQPMDCYPPQCQCDGCRMGRAWQDHNIARAQYSEALYAFLAPTSVDTPPALELLQRFGSDGAKDAFWNHMKRIYETGEAYIAACKAAGVRPNWRAALFPGEDL